MTNANLGKNSPVEGTDLAHKDQAHLRAASDKGIRGDDQAGIYNGPGMVEAAPGGETWTGKAQANEDFTGTEGGAGSGSETFDPEVHGDSAETGEATRLVVPDRYA